MNVSLTARLEEFVRRKVASGLYNNASEVVREGLRLLVERENAALGAQHSARRSESPDLAALRGRLAALETPLRAKGIASLALFGSVVHGAAGPDSDVDVLVDVDPGFKFSLVDLVSVKGFLEDHLGRPVDLVTRDGLDPAIEDRVLAEAVRVF